MTPTPDEPRPEGWLGYDGRPGLDGDAGSATHDQADESTSSPWLRHDLPAEGAAGEVPTRDPAWLEPEVTVAPVAPSAAEAHDTGVPPTLGDEPSAPVAPWTPQGHTPRAQQPQRPARPHVPSYAAAAAHQAPAGAAAAQGSDEPRGEPDDGDTGPTGEAATSRGERREAESTAAGGLSVMLAAAKEFVIVVGMALVLSFIVKTWLLQAFYIPSGSMEDTLVLNDRVIVSKLTPGPVDLKRGDIIVFADPGSWLDETPQQPHGAAVTLLRDTMTFIGLLPDDAENHLIKRVIGLPGDHVVCCDEGGRITVNGTPIQEPYLKPGDAPSEQDFDITVPKGRVWVMGDHRSNSADSRAHDSPENDGSRGSVDERLIVGRAVVLIWPLNHFTWLSNPTSTFAKVPSPSPVDQGLPAREPPGDPGADQGGTEVPGGDGATVGGG